MASGALSTFQMTQDVIANRPAPAAYLGFWYATDQGTLYYSNGVAWRTIGTNDVPVIMRSGMYTDARTGGTVAVSGTVPNQQLRVTPMPVPRDLVLTRIVGECTVVGDAGSVLRLGIYADDGQGRPGNLILDAGTIPMDAVGIAEIVINQALGAGLYWAASCIQAAPVTLPTVRVLTSLATPVGTITVPTAGSASGGYAMTAVAGALPTPFVVAEATFINSSPRIWIKAA